MRKINSYLIILLVFVFGCNDQKFKINGKEGYQIVIPSQADSLTQKAAGELQFYLTKLPKTDITIINESEYKGDKAIYIGRTDYSKTLDINFSQLETDGYAFKQHKQNFIIAGGSEKGTLYGVYDLLQSIGFRKYTSDYTYIPTVNSITLPNDTVFVPQIKYRKVSFNDALDRDYADWHKLDVYTQIWGSWVHTFNRLVPPHKYGKTHPEYYAFWDGKRHSGEGSELCLSNPEVLDIVIKNMKLAIAEKPHMKYWSVSQNDNNNPCRCDACKKLNEKYGGDPDRHSGSIIYFVNKVAKEFPDKTISTLAYWYSRESPENIKLEPNVNIMLCDIESKRHKPVPQTDPEFANALKDWGKLAKSIIVWDYTVQFRNLVSPFPNLHTLKPNIKFFVDNNVTEMYEQGDRYSNKGGDMIELKSYLIAKLLWNPEADDQAIIDDFVNGYYGTAAPYIRQYIDTIRNSLLQTEHQLGIFDCPSDAKNTYLGLEMMEVYKELFDKAENAVAEEPELLKRVQRARLPIMYAEIEIGNTEIDTPRSMYKHTEEGNVIVKPEMKKLVYQFVQGCKEQGIVKLREWTTPPEVYLGAYTRIFEKTNDMKNVKSFHKKIIPITSPDSENITALTDGVFASYESYHKRINWIGFRGKHMDFIVDLGETVPVGSVNIDFLNGRTPFTPIFLPRYVTYEISVDGKNYSDAVKIINPLKPNREAFDEEFCVKAFQADMNNSIARYIKVHAENILKCPSWHMETGTPAWLFADEIVVK